ncbi:MAG: cache domain-containing protein, partial [Spirochaetales bacterium]|nr:cache domain-containing protein [Spirochaetales bacterium]
ALECASLTALEPPGYRLREVVYSTRFRLIAAFLGVSLSVGGLSLLVGAGLLHRNVLHEASDRVRLDLNAAREIYNNVESRALLACSIASQQPGLQRAVIEADSSTAQSRIQAIANQARMDFAGLILPNGETFVRLGGEDVAGSPSNPAALESVRTRAAVSGTAVLGAAVLSAESESLAEIARISLVETPMAAPRDEPVETDGMTIAAAVPIFYQGALIGSIYGGVLLNRDREIVDGVRDTVFLEERFRGRDIGTVTIFLRDLRVSTNVLDSEGNRAIGTRVSEQVRQRVLEEGLQWTDRAFVVNDWYITAYEPVTDIFGDRVGILYVGVLEAKYVQITRNSILLFALITSAGVVIAIVLGSVLGQRILDPVHRLIDSSKKVSSGDLSPDIGSISQSEIGVLQRTFVEMLESLKDRDQRQRAESERKLLQSEKQASIGRLAAGVAHEINNPLTGVVTFTHLLLGRGDLPDDIRADLEVVAESTERVRKIVKGLLDFARQVTLEPEPTNLNDLIECTIPLVANQALMKRLIICFDPCLELPLRTLDKNLFESVLLNIIINAIDATDSGGRINISTSLSISSEHQTQPGIEVVIEDSGRGIAPEHLDKLFDPFFTTKDVGKGTGLGLSVSQGIVDRHGGSIRVQSVVDKGSIFTVWLPLDSEGER